MIEDAKRKLQEIEYSKRTWKSEFIREQEIWDEIAMNLCSYKDEDTEHKFWIMVMDLYHQKYR